MKGMTIIMSDCLFCKIIAGEIPSDIVYEDENVLAFRDIAPKAPVHVLVIPKLHIKSAADITADNSNIAAKCLEVVATIAKKEHLDSGFRIISNSGPDAGQTVDHLHFHLVGGTKLGFIET